LTRKIHDPRWRKRPPRQIHGQFQQSHPVSISTTTVPRNDSWLYIKFLYEELVEPRSRIESRLKDRYEHCYRQGQNLGLTQAQWIGGGDFKQVFLVENLSFPQPQVIKLFNTPIEWQSEKDIYDKHDCKTQYLLPHKYYQYYAVCDRVEVVNTEARLQRALDQGKITNTDFAKKIFERFTGSLHNFGFYQDMLVWIDIDTVQI